jgi:AcrR family transcriptional regulator
MQNLRSRKKETSRQAMLDIAKRLFIEHGYSRTTMENIAEQAGFGVATVYTYFGTKEGLFAQMARLDMGELKAQGEAALEHLPAEPIDAVITLINIYNHVYDFISYSVMNDFIIQSKSNGPLHETAAWVHDWQKAQVAEALRRCRESGTVAPALDVDVAADIVIDLVERHHIRIAAWPDDPHTFASLERAIEVLFQAWLA